MLTYIHVCLKIKNNHSIELILGDLLQSVFSVVSAPDNTVQSKLVSLTKTAGF